MANHLSLVRARFRALAAWWDVVFDAALLCALFKGCVRPA